MEQELKLELPLNAMPWEGKPPLHSAYGFKQAVGNIEVTLGYCVYAEAVLLFATLRFPGQAAYAWRQHWASYTEAVRTAEELCADSMEYLEAFNAPMRPVEDLDYNDFLEHLHARLNNNLH